MDQGLFCECTDAERWGQFRAVFQGHLLGCVVGVKAVLWLALLTCAAFTTHCAPVHDDKVAFLNVGDIFADGFYNACGFMAEQERESVFNVTVAVCQVGMAYTAGLDLDDDVIRAWFRDNNGDSFYFCAFFAGDYSGNVFAHVARLSENLASGGKLKIVPTRREM